jgi:HK97 family phage major capsid protein
LSIELASKIDALGEKYKATSDELATRIQELERRAARIPANDNRIVGSHNSFATAILESDEVKNLSSSFRGRATIRLSGERADVTSSDSTVGAGRSAGTSLVPGMRVPGVVTPFERQLRVRDLCTQLRTASGNVEWVKETGFTNSARPVTETTTKPKSDLQFNLMNAPVRTIAHIFKISRQMLDDAPMMANYIAQRGQYGLKLVEESQLLAGDNTGQNLHGIIPQASAFSAPFSSTAEQAFDRINQALAQVEQANAIADGIVLNATDWRQMLGIKDGQDRYISGQSPFGLQTAQLWNVPVIPSLSVPQNEFLVGSFANNAIIFDRLSTEVLLSTENDDDFETNRATVRVESRLSFILTRPEAMVSGDLTSST